MLPLTTTLNGLSYVLRYTTFVLRNAYGCVVNVCHGLFVGNVFIPLHGAIKHVAC